MTALGYLLFLLLAYSFVSASWYVAYLGKLHSLKIEQMQKAHRHLMEKIVEEQKKIKAADKLTTVEEYRLNDLFKIRSACKVLDTKRMILILDDDGKEWFNSARKSTNSTPMPTLSLFDVPGLKKSKFPFHSLVKKAKTGTGTSILLWGGERKFASSMRSAGGFFTIVVMDKI